jgi:glycosyltransferase involved in cell wall biosynthesis
MILFSVLIANYNNGRYLSGAIQSVVNQTYSNWEIVLVDDASTDNSNELVMEFIARGINIRYFRHNKNLGVGATKSDCTSLARGEIVGFLDPDDQLMENAISVMVETHNSNPAASLVFSTHFSGDENLGNRSLARWIKEIPSTSTNLYMDMVAHFVSFKLSAYNQTTGIDRALSSAEDKDLYYKLEEKGPLVFVNKPLYIYRRHKSGISQFENYQSAQDNHLDVIKAAMLRRGKNGYKNLNWSQYRKVKSRIYLQRGEALMLSGHPRHEVYKWLMVSFLNYPFCYNLLRIKYLFLSCIKYRNIPRESV